MKKRILSLLLSLSLCLSLFSCGQEIAPFSEEKTETEETESLTLPEESELSEEEKAILTHRRETVCDYMHQMATLLWRSDREITYTLKSGIRPEEDPDIAEGPTRLTIEKGRLYRGLPYTYAGNGTAAFLDYTLAPDDKGVYTLTEPISWEVLSGGFSSARVGNDCSTAVTQAWGQVSTTVEVTNTAYMCADKGYLPVGNYTVSDSTLSATKEDCMVNEAKKMYECYAALQKADAVVQRNDGSGHAMMVTAVHVERTENGINGAKSYVTVTHQTRSYYRKNAHEFDEALGEEVYSWYGIGDRYSFAKLFDQGYLPITCKELVDPTPLPPVKTTDTETSLTLEGFLEGTVTANRLMDLIKVTVEGSNGAVLQSLSLPTTRKEKHEFECCALRSKDAVGKLNTDEFPTGSYKLKMTARLSDGEEVVLRELSFTR